MLEEEAEGIYKDKEPMVLPARETPGSLTVHDGVKIKRQE